jgi:peptide/nickel transport system ATP-binding protein
MSSEAVISVQRLTKHFPIKMGFFKTILAKDHPVVRAVEDVSFEIAKGEVFGLVGESGSGKTTVGRTILRLIEPTSGKVFFEGVELTSLSPEKMREMRRNLQIVFQDPYESLNPRLTVVDAISEPMRLQGAHDEEEITKRVKSVLVEMDLVPPEQFMYRFPHEVSGGQRQRVAIARAFVTQPEFIVADEPLSMLDASVRTGITELMLQLVENLHVSMLYITHDIALARYMCDRIGVMYLGEIVEMGSVDSVVQNPLHPYTLALMQAVPVPDPKARRIKVVISGEIPSAIFPPSGCRFHTRCPKANERCEKEKPQLVEVEKGRFVACYSAEGM